MSVNNDPFIQKLIFSKNIINEDFDFKGTNIKNIPLFKFGYQYYLTQKRENMNIDEFKKRRFYLIVNRFENIVPDYEDHLNNLLEKSLKGKIINRDFYKMWELICYFNIINEKSNKFLCVSENGGFLQSILNFRNKYYNSKNDSYFYHNSKDEKFIKKIDEFKFIKKEDSPLETFDTSNYFTSVKNIDSFIIKNKLKDIDLITCNGIINSNDLEIRMYELLIGQIILALSLNSKGGSFIFKFDDCFTNITFKLFNILFNCYSEVYIVKPLFSRSFINEKYLVCKSLNIQDKKKLDLLKKLKILLSSLNRRNEMHINDIITNYEFTNVDIEKICSINNLITSDEYLNINMVVDYNNKKNYFGEQYHKYKEAQMDASKFWNDKFMKDKISEITAIKVT